MPTRTPSPGNPGPVRVCVVCPASDSEVATERNLSRRDGRLIRTSNCALPSTARLFLEVCRLLGEMIMVGFCIIGFSVSPFLKG